MIKTFKFGGSSIKDKEGVMRVSDILQTYKGEQMVIVVSAMGKTTNAMEKVVSAFQEGDTEQAIVYLEEIKKTHFELASSLMPDDQNLPALLNDLFVEIEWIFEEAPDDDYDYCYDQIVGVGELLSSRIVAAWLNAQGLPTEWLDARDLIRTDDHFREGWVQWQPTTQQVKNVIEPLVSQGRFVLTQGFIASNNENQTVTLGREGSDYTAAILSYCLDAESMTIWKDVPGVLTADPRVFENTSKLDRLSYREAIEMTYYGAKVIHPKTIKPLQNKNIPMWVRSYLNPQGGGTRISSDIQATYPPIVTIEQHQALLHVATRDFSFVAEHHLSLLFKHIADLRLQVNMMQNTAISFAVCVNDFSDRVDEFIERIEPEFSITIDRGLELITVRHFNDNILNELKKGKMVMLEMRLSDTAQFVSKEAPAIKRK